MTATRPTAEQAVRILQDLPQFTDLGIAMTVIAGDRNGHQQGYDIKLSPAAAAGLAEIAEVTRARVQDSTLIGYSPTTLIPPGHCMHVPTDSAASLTEIQAVVDISDNDAFDAKAEYAKRVSMAAATFRDSSGLSVTFYRVADTLLQFTKNKVFSLVQRNGRYDRLEPADVLLMRAEFDVVVIFGHAFFFLKPTFERAFGFVEELQRASAATFDRVTKGLRIVGLDELRRACTSQPQMMAKMASIRRSMDDDPDYAAAMTMPKLIAYVESNPSVSIEIAGAGASRALVFNPSPATRYQIVKLLDDDYLRSVLTDRDYEAVSKTRGGHA